MKICIIGNLLSPFVKRDLNILQEKFEVLPFYSGLITKRHLFKFILKMTWAVFQSDISFSWFAGEHAAVAVFLSKILGKKSIVVVGGWEVADAPEINYGRLTRSLLTRMTTKFALKFADLVLSVSEFTKNEILEFEKPKRLRVVYNGVDIDKFKPTEKKNNLIITIGNTEEYKLKGLDTFTKTSSFFPDYKFVIIGKKENSIVNKLKKINTNLIFTGMIPHDEVLKWLQRAKVYCQLSYRESFGMGVAEAMSCGCIPVITDRGALLEVVGDLGFYVPYGDAKKTAEAIEKAIHARDELRKMCRKRIEDKFSINKRKDELFRVIKEII